MGCFVHREDVFTDDMIQAKVHFIQCQSLLEVAGVDSAEILVKISIINFKTSKLGVLDAYIYSDHCKCYHMRFKGL